MIIKIKIYKNIYELKQDLEQKEKIQTRYNIEVLKNQIKSLQYKLQEMEGK